MKESVEKREEREIMSSVLPPALITRQSLLIKTVMPPPVHHLPRLDLRRTGHGRLQAYGVKSQLMKCEGKESESVFRRSVGYSEQVIWL